MKNENHMPIRLRRLATISQSHPRFFLTLCTTHREPCLACDDIHRAFIEFMQGSPKRYGWSCGAYVLMPDHAHYFAAPFPECVTLGAWVKATKAFIRVSAGDIRVSWQAGFFDHVLRSDESYAEKWEYVRENPVRARLAAKPDDWPFWGQIDIHEL
jgi:REP element-mobilizing transposase RayT